MVRRAQCSRVRARPSTASTYDTFHDAERPLRDAAARQTARLTDGDARDFPRARRDSPPPSCVEPSPSGRARLAANQLLGKIVDDQAESSAGACEPQLHYVVPPRPRVRDGRQPRQLERLARSGARSRSRTSRARRCSSGCRTKTACRHLRARWRNRRLLDSRPQSAASSSSYCLFCGFASCSNTVFSASSTAVSAAPSHAYVAILVADLHADLLLDRRLTVAGEAHRAARDRLAEHVDADVDDEALGVRLVLHRDDLLAWPR